MCHTYPPPVFPPKFPSHYYSPPPSPPSPPSQYAAQASNQSYQQQEQQRTSGSSGAVVVVAPRYCLPQAFSLAVTEKVLPSSRGDWTITDPAGKSLFTVDGKVWPVGNRRHLHLLAAQGHKVIHMQRKQKRKVCNNNIFLLQQRGIKWCPKNSKPYIMNLSLSHLIPCALLLLDRTLNFLRKIWSVPDEHSLKCLLSKHYMMLEEIHVAANFFLCEISHLRHTFFKNKIVKRLFLDPF